MNDLKDEIILGIEIELQRQIGRLAETCYQPFYEILSYHMGWAGENGDPVARGKRIRPLLLLLTCLACGTEWQPALPAAASVELVHNFSLIHDDIQDNSSLRRGRKTVWVKWGMPQGINAGDALFVLSNQALLDLQPTYPIDIILEASRILLSTCLNLTKGQFLDMSYEKKTFLSEDEYWPMISGKTAALISACTSIGALLGGAGAKDQDAWCNFGHYLGLAFQIQDDYLGIWGDLNQLGKSTDSDLVSGKKTFPIVYGLSKKGVFFNRWNDGPISIDEVPGIAEQLAKEGARLYTQEVVDQMSDTALNYLRVANPVGKAGDILFDLTNQLLNRKT
jgi:geranylgeranyl diphosphate synthase type I